MPTREEYVAMPLAARLQRLATTPDVLATAIRDRRDADLGRRPDARNWSPTEILRDVEELFQVRFHTILALDEPTILVLGAPPEDLAAWRFGSGIGHPLDPDRWRS